jgi:hypothetical protein
MKEKGCRLRCKQPWIATSNGESHDLLAPGRETDDSTFNLCALKDIHLSIQCPGVQLGHPVPGGYKYGYLDLRVGGVSKETVKYGRAGLRPKSDRSDKAQSQLYSKLQTRPFVREDATK